MISKLLATVSMKPRDPVYMEEYAAFSSFIGQYGRTYATKNEHSDRFETFRMHYKEIKEHNQKFETGEVGFEKAIN